MPQSGLWRKMLVSDRSKAAAAMRDDCAPHIDQGELTPGMMRLRSQVD